MNLFIDAKLTNNLTEIEQQCLDNLYEKRDMYIKEFEKNKAEGLEKQQMFSIIITDSYSDIVEGYSLAYIINDDMAIKESNNCRKIYGSNAKMKAFSLAAKDFENINKRVLLYLGKFPGYGFDIDGGSILARQLIDSLKVRCKLTVCFIRKNDEVFEDEKVGSINYVKYKDPWNNKFIRRLENLDTNYEALCHYNNYDIIIAAHISKYFGMNECGARFWKKTILFPMFCTRSYIRAGENVPIEYTKQEKIVIDNVNKIITPSVDERDDLISDYKCSEDKISVITRGITPLISYSYRTRPSEILQIVCIGTIKTQKNTKSVLELIQKLIDKRINCKLHLVCTIQDKLYYEELCELVRKNNMEKRIVFHVSIPQSELAELLTNMDINVSMSMWETFGRGIFEGATAGLPTFVFDVLKTVKNLTKGNKGIYFASSLDDMVREIVTTVSGDMEKYSEMSKSLSEIATTFSYKTEQNLLLETIFN